MTDRARSVNAVLASRSSCRPVGRGTGRHEDRITAMPGHGPSSASGRSVLLAVLAAAAFGATTPFIARGQGATARAAARLAVT